jgi:serine/threonine-protein kinase
LSFFKELIRRNVYKVGIAYVIIAWLVAQVLQLVFESFGTPDWVMKTILVLLVTGLPFALFFAWAFEITPEGIKREDFSAEDNVVAESPEPVTEAVEETSAPARASVAVLPFVNMSGNQENEYFSDGLSEELLNVLAKVNALKVAARTSSFHFKGQTGSIAEIAQSLGVSSVLEGSVRQSGTRVRITAQLINAADGYHLWSETFDRELTDIFKVQDEIAYSVTEALKVKLLGDDAVRLNVGGTHNTAAFKEYLQGVHYRNRGSDQASLQSAADAFQRAIDLDPEYALAYAGLATAWEELVTNNFVGLEYVTSKVCTAAGRAIELAPDLADGYQVTSRMLLYYKLDQKGSLEAINTALKLNPGNVDVQIEYSRSQSIFLAHDEALAAARTALDLDPVSMFANHFLGHALYFARRYDEAVTVFRNVLELDPHYPRPHYEIGMCRFKQGDLESALHEVEQEPLNWMKFSGMAIVLQHLGHTERAEASLAALIKDYRENGLYQQAQVYAQWGDNSKAIQTLNKAHEFGDPGTSQLLVDPLLDPIRDDVQFSELLRKTGFTH